MGKVNRKNDHTYADMTDRRYDCISCQYGKSAYGDKCPCYECNAKHCGYKPKKGEQ